MQVYWVVNLVDNQIEVLTEPSGPVEKPNYAQRAIFQIGSSLQLIIDQKQLGVLAVRDILG